MHAFDFLVAAFALVQLARYVRRAVPFLLPSRRVSAAAAAPSSAATARAGAELQRLGFVPLGAVQERGPLGIGSEWETFASPARQAYADVQEGRPEPVVTFFTPFPGGAAVITARAARRAIVGPRTQAGGMPDAPLEAVLAAHRVAVERFRAAHGEPSVAAALESRLQAARAWYAGEGRREVRRAALFPFAVAVLSALVFVSAVNILFRSAT